jgi:arylsulfatase A-like enzyme
MAQIETSGGEGNASHRGRPNILILCMDQWQTHMQVPEAVEFPAMRRLEAQGVSFDRQYCTVPICTPSRATMWTGVHAKKAGLSDNTNFAWIHELSSEIPTIGHLMREQGYYTAFKGKWHLSEVPRSEDALERYGFSDLQQWGEMFGTPLQGEMLDGAAVFQTIDWLERKAPQLGRPWLLVCSLVNPHDVMYLQTDPVEKPHPKGAMAGKQTPAQRMGWFEKKWDVQLPDNFADNYELQPFGVHHYKEIIDKNYGRVPDDREDLWRERRNYLVNAMRLVDREFGKILDALDRLDLWRSTIVFFVSDHGEMNGAHRMTQKGAIHFDEAAVVNLTVCVPGGAQGKRTGAVGSHLDLAPTLLEFAGLTEEEIRSRYRHLKGRSLKSVILDPAQDGPRGSAKAPGDGALFCWDGLHSLDHEWAVTGAPNFRNRTFFRAVVDGRYKMVRWFSPEDYKAPATIDELYTRSDVSLHDLIGDPGEMENIGHPDHPAYDPQLVERMLYKLNALIEREIGEDRCPFDLDLFGTRKVRYGRTSGGRGGTGSGSVPTRLRGAKRSSRRNNG